MLTDNEVEVDDSDVQLLSFAPSFAPSLYELDNSDKDSVVWDTVDDEDNSDKKKKGDKSKSKDKPKGDDGDDEREKEALQR